MHNSIISSLCRTAGRLFHSDAVCGGDVWIGVVWACILIFVCLWGKIRVEEWCCELVGSCEVQLSCEVRRSTSSQPDWLIERGLTSHQTHFRWYRGQVFTGQMTQPTVSEQPDKNLYVLRVVYCVVKELVAKLAASSKDDDTESVSSKCSVLNQKLDALIKTLHEESHAASQHQVVCLSVCLSQSVCMSVCLCLSVCPSVSLNSICCRPGSQCSEVVPGSCDMLTQSSTSNKVCKSVVYGLNFE